MPERVGNQLKSTQCKSHVDSWECFFESLNIGRLECFVVEKTEVQQCNSQEFGNFKLASTKLLLMSKGDPEITGQAGWSDDSV